VQNISTLGLFLSKKSVFSWQIIEFLNNLLEFFENLLEFFFGLSFFGLEFFSKCPKKKPEYVVLKLTDRLCTLQNKR